MNGIKMKDCKFYVDEPARVVVCVIPNTKEIVQDFIDEHFSFNDIDFGYLTNWGWVNKALRMPHSFSGKAVCAPEDKWDEETGRMIAFARAKDKCYKSFFKRANAFVQKLDTRLGDIVTTFNDFGLKLETRREALQAKIDERIQSPQDT